MILLSIIKSMFRFHQLPNHVFPSLFPNSSPPQLSLLPTPTSHPKPHSHCVSGLTSILTPCLTPNSTFKSSSIPIYFIPVLSPQPHCRRPTSFLLREGDLWFPTNAHVLIPETWEYVITFHGKRDFAAVIELMISRGRDYPGLSGPNIITRVF